MKRKLKKSTLLLLAGAGGVLVLTIAAVIGFRIIVGDAVSFEPLEGVSAARGPDAVREFPIDGASRLQFNGTWKAGIRHGEQAVLIVHAPEELLPQIRVVRSGNTAKLSWDGRIRLGGRTVRAEIVLPALTGIESGGAVDIDFSGFIGETLEIESTGAANVRGENSGFRDIRIDSSGALNADLRDAPTENADVDVSGSARVMLTMTGGLLSGEISGAGKVVYSGEVSEERIETSGLASIERR